MMKENSRLPDRHQREPLATISGMDKVLLRCWTILVFVMMRAGGDSKVFKAKHTRHVPWNTVLKKWLYEDAGWV